MNKVEKLKEKARILIGNMSLEMSVEEKEISNELDRILSSKNIDIEYDEKLLNQIELYILIKDRMNKKDENYNYLKDIANDLRTERVRKGDVSKGFPLFKVIKNKKLLMSIRKCTKLYITKFKILYISLLTLTISCLNVKSKKWYRFLYF